MEMERSCDSLVIVQQLVLAAHREQTGLGRRHRHLQRHGLQEQEEQEEGAVGQSQIAVGGEMSTEGAELSHLI